MSQPFEMIGNCKFYNMIYCIDNFDMLIEIIIYIYIHIYI